MDGHCTDSDDVCDLPSASCEDEANTAGDVASQLSQLQDLVREMKSGFATAVEALARVQYGDRLLEQRVDQNQQTYEQQLADVIAMVLALKTEFGGMASELKLATETQKTLQQRVDLLQCENDILLEELERAGSISPCIRQKYHSGERRATPLNRSTDSTPLTVLLERARSTFTLFPPALPSSRAVDASHSEHDSGMTASQAEDGSSDDDTQDIGGELDENYDSDSSLAATVNKSLDLGRSLEDKCAELSGLRIESSEDEGSEGEGEEERRGEEDEDCQPSSSVICQADVQSTPKPEAVLYAHSSPMCKLYASPRTIAPHERNAKESQRGRVAREILETERSYCSSLWLLLDHFAASLRHSAIVPIKDVSVMFPPCLVDIYRQHCAFLQQLEERLLSCKWQCVLGDVFARLSHENQGDLLKQYQEYVNAFPAALQHIRKSCRNNQHFKKFIHMSQRDERCRGLDIGSFLLTPIQRVPRYVLLLKKLLHYTDKSHPDCYYIESSLQTLATFLNKLNDSIENSFQLVANSSPKIKRKTWLAASFRSSSSSHDGDAGQLSSATKDSGVQSSVDEPNPTTTTVNTTTTTTTGMGGGGVASRSNTRLFPFGMLRDSGAKRKLQLAAAPSVPTNHPLEPTYTPPITLSDGCKKRTRRPHSALVVSTTDKLSSSLDEQDRSQCKGVDRVDAAMADYGVYGDSDDDDDDDVMLPTPTMSVSTLPRASLLPPQSMHHRPTLANRCVSHCNISSSTPLSQSHINSCVAHSLMDVTRGTAAVHQMDTNLADVSTMTLPDDRKLVKKRRRHTFRKADSELRDKKKNSIRDSLKNIFFKKRNSPSMNTTINNTGSSKPISTVIQPRLSNSGTPTEFSFVKPINSHIISSKPPTGRPHSVCVQFPELVTSTQHPDLVTFHDENGDPFSAV